MIGLAFVALYVFGSWLHLKPLKIGGMQLVYPRLPIVFAQLTVGPIEILAAASIVYFALPEAGNPGYIVVLGIFVVAFSIASISHAPGGLGVFEYVALAGLSDMDKVSVLAALVVFRLCYLIIPLIIAIIVVIDLRARPVRDSGDAGAGTAAGRVRRRVQRTRASTLGKPCGLDYLRAGARSRLRRAVRVARSIAAPWRRLLGNRLTVDPRTLTPLVLVRIQVPQPT